MRQLIKSKQILQWLLPCLIIFTSFGCQSKKSDSDAETTSTDTTQTSERKLPTDTEIRNVIENELLVRNGIEISQLKVNTKGGIVTLNGTVTSILEKDRAVQIARSFKGVRGVIDHLEVQDLNISDEVVESNVKQALELDPAIESDKINVDVMQGVVDLNGEVDSWQEKSLTEDITKGIVGVERVDNNLIFDYTQNRSDEEILDDVLSALNWNIRVDDALLDVMVNDGHVTIDGTVGSATEKNQTESLAWVSGVKSVDASNVDVKAWARADEMRAKKYGNKTDDEISEAIADAFLYDPRVSSYDILAEVDNGKVTLTGVVDNLKAKRVAEHNAKNVVGVWQVNNLLEINGENAITEDELQSKIERSLSLNPVIEPFEIDVQVENGKAIADGLVNTYYEKYIVEDLISKIKGIRDVENNINVAVNVAPYAYDYEYHYYHPYNKSITTVESGKEMKSDMELKNDIIDQIWWSPFVDLKDIEIAVDSGTVTLKGTVSNLNEFYQAELNAYDGGARKVNNELEIISSLTHNKSSLKQRVN